MYLLEISHLLFQGHHIWSTIKLIVNYCRKVTGGLSIYSYGCFNPDLYEEVCPSVSRRLIVSRSKQVHTTWEGGKSNLGHCLTFTIDIDLYWSVYDQFAPALVRRDALYT